MDACWVILPNALRVHANLLRTNEEKPVCNNPKTGVKGSKLLNPGAKDGCSFPGENYEFTK